MFEDCSSMERQINIYSNIYTYFQIFGLRYKLFIPIFKYDYLYLGTNDLNLGTNHLYLSSNTVGMATFTISLRTEANST